MTNHSRQLIDHDQRVLSFSIFKDEETVIVLSPKLVETLHDLMFEIFNRILSSMNPRTSIPRRRIVKCSNFDITRYNPPSRIFDVKRLWKTGMKFFKKNNGKNDKRNNKQVKVRDPLKLRRKCSEKLKIASVPCQPLILIHDDGKYIPPTSTNLPPHILSVRRKLPNISGSPFFSETEVLEKFRPPSPLNIQIKAKLKLQPHAIISKICNFPQELPHEKYKPPPGSKENYSSRNVSDITAAEEALEAASIALNPSSQTISETISNCSSSDSEFSPSEDDELELEENDSFAVPQKYYDNYLETDNWDTDGEWTKLHRVTSSLFSDSDNEMGSDPMPETKPEEEPNKEEKTNELEFEEISKIMSQIQIGDGVDGMKIDDAASSSHSTSSNDKNLKIEIVEMNLEKPHPVRRALDNSLPVQLSELIEKILAPIPTHGENGLDEYRPPSQEMENITLDKIILNSNLKQEVAQGLRSKSCCVLDNVLKPITDAVSDTCLIDRRKPPSKTVQGKRKCKNLNRQPPKHVNSIDEVLKLRVTNPIGFFVLQTLCSKQLALYEGESAESPLQIETKRSKVVHHYHRRKLLSTFCQAILSTDNNNDGDDGYLGSEEDEEYKTHILKDFWPIRSQCTKIDTDSSLVSLSISFCGCDLNSKSKDLIEERAGQDPILIDYDDAEYWSWISEYEDLFAQSRTITTNVQENLENLENHGFRRARKQNNDQKIKVSISGRPTGCGRCMSKIWKWWLLKNL